MGRHRNSPRGNKSGLSLLQIQLLLIDRTLATEPGDSHVSGESKGGHHLEGVSTRSSGGR
jgi:hypothetical protein